MCMGMNTSSPSNAISTFSPMWLGEYVKQNYQMDDPILKHMTVGERSAHWSELSEPGNRVMAAAESHGMTEGWATSVIVDGIKSSISITCGDITDEEKTAVRHFLYMYALDYKNKKTPDIYRHYHVVDLLANGATNAEMETVLGVSTRKRRDLVIECLDFFKAKSTGQLVAENAAIFYA